MLNYIFLMIAFFPWSLLAIWLGSKLFTKKPPNILELQPVSIVPKPWGHEKIWAHTDKYVGKILNISKGQRLSKQYHKKKDETVYVLSGLLDLSVELNNQQQSFKLEPGKSYHIHPGVIHRMTALEENTQILEVSTPQLKDVVRLSDDYGR